MRITMKEYQANQASWVERSMSEWIEVVDEDGKTLFHMGVMRQERAGTPRELVEVTREVDEYVVCKSMDTRAGQWLGVVAGLAKPTISLDSLGSIPLTPDDAETLAAMLMWAAKMARGG